MKWSSCLYWSVLLFFTILSCAVHAQPGLKAKALAATPSPTPAATPATSNYQTGHVYRLRQKKHAQYSSVTPQVFYFRLRDIPVRDRATIFGVGAGTGNLTTATFQLDRVIRKNMSQTPLQQAEYFLRPLQPPTKKCISKPKCDGADPCDDTVVIVSVTYYDSIPRYFNAHQRLRFSVNQDSAVLNLQLYTIIDNQETSIQTDQTKVTNPNFRYLSSKKSGQKQKPQTFLYSELVYSSQQKNSGPFQEAKDALYVPTPGQDYTAALLAYQTALFEEAQDRTNAVKHRTVIDRYSELEQKYEAAKKEYFNDAQVTYLQQAVDTRWQTLADPAHIADSIANRLAYVKALYDLASNAVKPPVTLPKNLVEEEFVETAIPITMADSASNFFFKVIHKATVAQSIYYKSVAYGTWDYGAITMPFRYRFPIPKVHIINMPGTPTAGNSATSGPEESDATLSLSGYVGRKWGRTRFYEDPTATKNTVSFEMIATGGPSLIALSAANVDSASKYSGVKNNYAYTGPANMLVFSAAGGFVMQWKAVNFGLVGGLDIPLTANTGWIYRDKFWIGFGVGVNLGLLSSSNQAD